MTKKNNIFLHFKRALAACVLASFLFASSGCALFGLGNKDRLWLEMKNHIEEKYEFVSSVNRKAHFHNYIYIYISEESVTDEQIEEIFVDILSFMNNKELLVELDTFFSKRGEPGKWNLEISFKYEDNSKGGYIEDYKADWWDGFEKWTRYAPGNAESSGKIYYLSDYVVNGIENDE